MPDPTSPSPHPRSPRVGGSAALEGEVLPPAIRTVNPSPPPLEEVAAAPPLAVGSRVVMAALGVLALALAGGAGAFGTYVWRHHAVVAGAQSHATTLALSRLGQQVADLKASVELAQQDPTVRNLKKGVDQLKAELDNLRTTEATAVAQLTGRLDKPVTPAMSPAIADVVARLDKLDHDPRLADITARLDRIERQVSAAAATGSITPHAAAVQPPATQPAAAPPPTAQSSASSPSAAQPSVAQTVVSQASLAAKPVRPVVLDNWIVRDVYSGIALVEGRSGSVREVVPGEMLPGAGEVRAIQRHGRGWVVVTSRGIIDTETW